MLGIRWVGRICPDPDKNGCESGCLSSCSHNNWRVINNSAWWRCFGAQWCILSDKSVVFGVSSYAGDNYMLPQRNIKAPLVLLICLGSVLCAYIISPSQVTIWVNGFKQVEHKRRDQLLLCLNGLTLSVHADVCACVCVLERGVG